MIVVSVVRPVLYRRAITDKDTQSVTPVEEVQSLAVEKQLSGRGPRVVRHFGQVAFEARRARGARRPSRSP